MLTILPERNCNTENYLGPNLAEILDGTIKQLSEKSYTRFIVFLPFLLLKSLFIVPCFHFAETTR